MTPHDEELPPADAGGQMGFGVQIILGALLVLAFCALAWLLGGNH